MSRKNGYHIVVHLSLEDDFLAELAVERFDEGVVRRLSRAGEVEGHAMEVGPEVEVAGDELGALVDPDRLREPDFGADPIERRDDVAGAVAEPRIDRRREARPSVDDGRHAQLAAGGELVVNEVHRPGFVGGGRCAAILVGTVGAVSVLKAVYVDRRELKCACVGGNSKVPLGFVSLTENVMMIGMALLMGIRWLSA